MILDLDEQALVESQLVDFSESMGKLETEGNEVFVDEAVGDEDGPL